MTSISRFNIMGDFFFLFDGGGGGLLVCFDVIRFLDQFIIILYMSRFLYCHNCKGDVLLLNICLYSIIRSTRLSFPLQNKCKINT